MLYYVIRRLGIAIPVLLGITILNFIIINLAPGNPAELLLDPNTSQAMIDAKKERLGLDQPFYIQYWIWLVSLLQGNMGYSYSSFAPVSQLISERIGPTLLLTFVSLIVSIMISIPIGIFSAVKRNSRWDYIITGLAFVGTSLPQFFLGLALIYWFALKLQWLPTGGIEPLEGGDLTQRVIHMILPVTVLSVAIIGKKVRYVRASMLDVLKQDYLQTARAKGLSGYIVIYRHALRNALIPIITVFGMEVPLLLGGSVIVEQVFQWPGIGQLTIQSVLSRDYPVIMGLNLVAALIVLIVNLFTDLLYRWVDPRVQYE
ncbi:peptide/nickel transport system permease protein [Paenibacillus sp. SORGH_AS306]|uniref:ABC transporter permease n=1 Tax=Paenibacillus kyungheensis TaxID=1452732 RepID=A0AAX3M3P5_9BACL|nr:MULTISPECIES: ABC transporter permease [Paenibacillus]MDQ1232710.1 peptide/nickel transport system permease protein [Paenibacillus sp. SORGH_AS_0306]MDR6109760.1 peptide/nickel transport system permease protein [Paenibacillus sp. SORGH_AS_0338]WCT56740.1 ABC transporter permease [Paenibacillus kyungheensis]